MPSASTSLQVLGYTPLLVAFGVHLSYAARHDQNVRNGTFPNWDVAFISAAAVLALVTRVVVKRRSRPKVTS